MDSTLDTTLMPSAEIACTTVLGINPGERLLIVTNPDEDVLAVSRALYAAAAGLKAEPVLMVQPVKSQIDYADPAVLAALHSRPDVLVSLSKDKLGKDPQGLKNPYRAGDREFDGIFDYLLYGEKSMRAFWSPGMTRDMFRRTVNIDYGRLKAECNAVKQLMDEAVAVRVECEAGTDLYIGLEGRLGDPDDGDFTRPGSGGNLPAGETFVSPALNSSEGTIAFRGSISLNKGDILIERPITARVEGGFITHISGGAEARQLEETIAAGESRALSMAAEGTLPAGMGEIYRRNARNIGELGIGLNPSAAVRGNMLEDEKAYRTCHIAVGANYDDDAPALIHCDGLIVEPDITFYLPGGGEKILMKKGELTLSDL